MSMIKCPSKKEVRIMAKDKGIALSHKVNVAKPIIKTYNKTKEMLIRELQLVDGYNDCYKTGVTICGQKDCKWFLECQK